jgi:hypothetical protein
MSSQRELLTWVIAWTAGVGLALFIVPIPAMAQSNSADYILLIGSGFLCDSGDSSACPVVVKSAQGDSFEMSGVGTLSTPRKSITATGTFTHKSPNGNTIETGVWVASELVSFDSYGIAPGALTQEGRVFGSPQFGPRRMPMLARPMPAGGLAVVRVRLLPMSGPPKTATVQVNCALGKVPDEHPTEGIRLVFEGVGEEFDQEISGRTIFILTRPGADPAAKPPANRGEANPAPAEVQQ